MTKDEAAELISARRLEKKLTWQQIAEAIDSPLVWTIAALLGQHPVPEAKAAKVAELLELEPQVSTALRAQPYRGTLDGGAPSDPTIYRLYEALSVYGPAIKEAIHEEFGDGIMSAINFKIDIARRPDPDGDRVVLTFDGSFSTTAGNRSQQAADVTARDGTPFGVQGVHEQLPVRSP